MIVVMVMAVQDGIGIETERVVGPFDDAGEAMDWVEEQDLSEPEYEVMEVESP